MTDGARRIAILQRELASNPASRQFYQLGELLRRDGRGEEAAEALRAYPPPGLHSCISGTRKRKDAPGLSLGPAA